MHEAGNPNSLSNNQEGVFGMGLYGNEEVRDDNEVSLEGPGAPSDCRTRHKNVTLKWSI